MILEGKIIGNRYEILEKIGNGGMATVYKAKCHVLNRYVAIKVLRDEFTTDEEFIKRFNTEAQSAASLTHPNIVSIYDVGNEGNLYYIVMELIQGKTLKEIIQEDGALPWKWSVNIAIQICSALEVAHKNNIIHRDIKPHNIIITEDGIAKVTDFGIAKAVSNSTITAFGTTIGSVHYFSPEHARGGFTDAKSDLYSLGIVMYEMLTGRVPFDADTPVSVALKHMQEKPVDPMKLNPAIPFAVNQVIMKAMQKEANLRYESASDMLKDLEKSLKNPEGNFVEDKNIESGYTQRIPTINSEKLQKNNNNRNNAERIAERNKKIKANKKKKIAILSISFIVLIILSVVGGYLLVSSMFGAPKNVTVPDVTGLTIAEAESKLKELKITYEISEEKYSSSVEVGKIISQNPPKGYRILENNAVKLVVSKGTEKTTIPKVVGKTSDEAKNDLENAKLTVETEEEISQKVEQGIVIRQEPAENTEVNAGDRVKIYISKGNGKKKVAVPSVTLRTEEEAQKELKDQGLEVEIAYEEDKSKANGTVLKQSIEVGTTVEEGTKIIITVNKIAERKRAQIYVNVKSLTNGGYTETNNTSKSTADNKTSGNNQTNVTNQVNQTESQDTTSEIVKTAKIRVEVDGEKIYEETVDKNIEKLNAGEAVGVGTVTVKVFVDGNKKGDVDIDLNNTTSYTFD